GERGQGERHPPSVEYGPITAVKKATKKSDDAILLAIALLIGLLFLPLWGFRHVDDYQRENNFISFTGGFLAMAAGFPVWVVLYAGGFAPAPHSIGLWYLGFAGLAVSYLIARWRP
ncbi:MAG: hypothetical protein AAF692_05745, partial [Pseudomonadota bacterium]